MKGMWWANFEENSLINAIQIHGINYTKLAEAVPTRTRQQIVTKVGILRRKPNLGPELAWKLLQNRHTPWTKGENLKLEEGLRSHGKNYNILQSCIKSKSKKQIMGRASRMKVHLLQKNSDSFDLLKILQSESKKK